MSEQLYATVGWTVSDVQSVLELSDKEAEDFLVKHGSEITDRLVEKGWEVIEILGRMHHLPEKIED